MAELILPTLEVKLECYEGPLSSLLDLVKKNRLSIWDVALSEIVSSFFCYVDDFQKTDLRIAEDFIEIVSSLIVLKSRMLISPNNGKEEDGDLIERMGEYEYLRKLTTSLERLPLLYRDTFVRERDGVEEDEDFDLYLLLRTFFALVKKNESFILEIKPIRPTLDEKLRYLEERLREKGIYIFDASEGEDLPEKVVTVLSMLEMVKRRIARIIQHRPFGKIILKRRVKI